jgi:inorganic pyrophosphatase
MDNTVEFWQYLDTLALGSRLVIDRPRGSTHPRFPDQAYPLDYGYLEGTTTVDGGGIDLWVGSNGTGHINGLLCTVDLFKRDGEMKLLFGCTEQDVQQILDFVNRHSMRAIYIPRHAGG